MPTRGLRGAILSLNTAFEGWCLIWAVPNRYNKRLLTSFPGGGSTAICLTSPHRDDVASSPVTRRKDGPMNPRQSIGFGMLSMLFSCGAVLAETEVIELQAVQSAAMSSTGCCTIANASSFGSSQLSTRNCQSVYMSCVSSKRAAMWLFDLSGLPEDAALVTASFVGTRPYNDMTGAGFMSIKGGVRSLNTNVGMEMWNAGDWRSNINWNYGTNFGFGMTSAVNGGHLGGVDSIALLVYGSSTGGITILNSGESAPRLRLVVELPEEPPCLGDLNDDGMVDSSDIGIFLAYWGSAPLGDLDDDGITDSSDLGVLLANWGPCP